MRRFCSRKTMATSTPGPPPLARQRKRAMARQALRSHRSRKRASARQAAPHKRSGKREAVGVIGLGIMGSAMAANLVRAGYRVVGYDVLPEAARRRNRQGGGPRDGVSGVPARP